MPTLLNWLEDAGLLPRWVNETGKQAAARMATALPPRMSTEGMGGMAPSLS